MFQVTSNSGLDGSGGVYVCTISYLSAPNVTGQFCWTTALQANGQETSSL